MIQAKNDRRFPVITLSGAITYELQEELKDVFRRMVENNAVNVVLDFSDVDLITSGGLGLLYTVQKEFDKRGGKLVIVAPKPAVEASIKDWRLDRFLAMFQTVDDACAHLQSAGDSISPL
jgi:anti-anti-sigma factor